MATKKKRRGNNGESTAVVNEKEHVEDLVRMVLDNVNKRQREKNIREIARGCGQ
jgi:hypothetical protein